MGILSVGVLGDIHGGLGALKKALKWLSTESLDYVLCVGDFASLSSLDPLRDLEVIREMFRELNSLGVPVIYVWGNRDLMLFNEIQFLDPRDRTEAAKIISDMLSMENLIEVPKDEKIKLGEDLFVTRNPTLLDERTVYLVHYDTIVRQCYLHVEGHVHYAQVKGRYLNAGFIHRDDLHGAKHMDGMVMRLLLRERGVERIIIKPLGNIKPLICDVHIDEGIFFVPCGWRKCPVCYDWNRAKFSRTSLHV